MSAETKLTEGLLEWLEAVEAAWAASGISRVERHRLARELELSIVEGLESGATEHDFRRDEPSIVAADIATANGLLGTTAKHTQVTRGSFLVTTLLGAALGAVAAWLLLVLGSYVLPFGPVLYACVLVCPPVVVALTLRRRFPHEPRMRRLQMLGAGAVLLGIVLAAIPSWFLSRSVTSPPIIPLAVPELLMATAICAAIVDLAYRLGWPQPTDERK